MNFGGLRINKKEEIEWSKKSTNEKVQFIAGNAFEQAKTIFPWAYTAFIVYVGISYVPRGHEGPLPTWGEKLSKLLAFIPLPFF
jgi:hypothetical protein